VAIQSVFINVTDIARSVDFYTTYLDLEPVKVTANTAILDGVTATLRLIRVGAGPASTWCPDDLQTGFRHLGFKVSDLDDRVARLHAGGVPFHLEPINAEGGVRITFFFDPDGTLLELVEGALQYQETYDRDAVEKDWRLGTPVRPRFDHIAETVTDLRTTTDYFSQLGYRLMAGIHQPSDPRGFEINFLRDGNSSLEIFSFDRAEKSRREPQFSAPGFAAVEFDGTVPASALPIGEAYGLELFADADGLVHAATKF